MGASRLRVNEDARSKKYKTHSLVTARWEPQLTIQVTVLCTVKFQQLTSTHTYDKLQHTSWSTMLRHCHQTVPPSVHHAMKIYRESEGKIPRILDYRSLGVLAMGDPCPWYSKGIVQLYSILTSVVEAKGHGQAVLHLGKIHRYVLNRRRGGSQSASGRVAQFFTRALAGNQTNLSLEKNPTAVFQPVACEWRHFTRLESAISWRCAIKWNYFVQPVSTVCRLHLFDFHAVYFGIIQVTSQSVINTKWVPSQ